MKSNKKTGHGYATAEKEGTGSTGTKYCFSLNPLRFCVHNTGLDKAKNEYATPKKWHYYITVPQV